MTDIILRRTYLKKPFKSIGVLVFVALFFEAFTWMFTWDKKVLVFQKYGGVFYYILASLRSLLLPEICTFLVVLTIIDIYHDVFKIRSIKLNVKEFVVYQLRILPVVLLVFFIFNPITQTVRFILENFPKYSFHQYIHDYFLGTFRLRIYAMYLIPVSIMGYATVNVSLLVDILAQRQSSKRKPDKSPLQTIPIQVNGITQTVNLQSGEAQTDGYLTHLKAKNAQGEMVLAVQDCYWFETEDRYYYAIHPTGRYQITKTINELATELNPEFFFRTKRNCIINLSFVAGFSYWENGKYIIRMQTANNDETDMPRARLQDFKNRLMRFSVQETFLSTGEKPPI